MPPKKQKRPIKGAAKSKKKKGVRGPESKRPGRPSKWKPEFCDKLVEHMATGFSFASFAGAIGVSKECIYNWEETKEEFSDACKKGQAALEYQLEKVLLALAIGKRKGNVTAAIWITKNLLGWRDKIEHSQDPEKPLTLSALMASYEENKDNGVNKNNRQRAGKKK